MSTTPPAPPRRGRVASAPPGAPSSEEPEPEPRRGLTVALVPFVLGALGLVLLGVLVLLVYLSGRAEPDPAATYTSAATDVVAVTGTPAVTVTPASSGSVMTVEISHEGAGKGDRFEVVVMSGNRSGEPDAQDFDETRRVTLAPGVSQYRVSVASGVRLCAKALTVRGASRSAWSAIQCEVQK